MLSIIPDDEPLNLKVNSSLNSPRMSQLLNPPLVKIESSHSPFPKDNALHQGALDLSPKKLNFTQDGQQNVEDSPRSDRGKDRRLYQSLIDLNSVEPSEQEISFEKRRLPLFYKHWSTGAVDNAALKSKNLRTRQRHQVQKIKQKLKTLDLAKEKSKQAYLTNRLRNKLSPGLFKWNLLKHVFRSIMLLQHQSAVIINESLSDHINSDFFNSCSDIFIKLNHVTSELNPLNGGSALLKTRPVQGWLDELKSFEETKATWLPSASEKENCQLREGAVNAQQVQELLTPQVQTENPELIPSYIPQKPLKLMPVYQGLEKKRKSDRLFKLIGEGNAENFSQIEKIVKEDPTSNLYQVNDNKHILNKKNDNNMTPLYMACQTGNLEVVKFLIAMGANPSVPTLHSQKESQTPLEVASRWSFIPVVSFLLNTHNFSKRELSAANASSGNKSIRRILKKKIESKSKHKGCFCI